MKKHFYLLSALIMGLSMCLVACDDDDDDDASSDDSTSIDLTEEEIDAAYEEIVAQYVDVVVLPTYKNLVSLNSDLYDAVAAFVSNPSDNNFAACAEAWLSAREPWECSEAFLFGPVDALGLDPNMDSWPLDVEAIVQILESGNYDELNWTDGDDDDAIEAAQNVRGFHTLEFLIFKDGAARTTSDTSDDESDYGLVYDSDNATSWGNYMQNVASLLKTDANDLYDAWNTSYDDGDAFASIFKNHSSSDYASAVNCIQQIIEGCADIASEVGEAKIGDPLNLYNSGSTTEALYAVESWFSWHSRDDYTNNIYSIRNSYYGSTDGTVSEKSISAFVAKYNSDLNDQVIKAIDAAAEAIQAIPQPFRNNINSEEALAAQEACADLENILTNTLKPYLINY